MLKETYLARMKQTARENPDAAFIVVTRSAGHVLSPSWKLLKDYKEGRIDWAGPSTQRGSGARWTAMCAGKR
ncbi:MAG: hypothetical protein ABIH80_02450 [Methanobacteriota archaeon]